MSWIDRNERPWLDHDAAKRARRKRERQEEQVEEQQQSEDQEPDHAYGVDYRGRKTCCPKCHRYDRVTVYRSMLHLSPPKRFHRCGRCDFNFKSLEYAQKNR